MEITLISLKETINEKKAAMRSASLHEMEAALLIQALIRRQGDLQNEIDTLEKEYRQKKVSL